MGNLGVGVMLNMIFGYGDSAEVFKAAQGKTIATLEMTKDRPEALEIMLTDGTGIRLFDDGQSCCEHRYMHTDDELGDFVGATLLDAEVRPGPETESGWGEYKESEFLVITTSIGQFTVVNYNEHNGYYGGFSVRCSAMS